MDRVFVAGCTGKHWALPVLTVPTHLEFNKKEESLKLNKAWLPALKNTAYKRSTNSTQPQGLVITTHKRPANDTHQSQ